MAPPRTSPSVVIVGGGMAGLVAARSLAHRGIPATVVERGEAGFVVPGPIMLPYQAYDALDEIGVLAPVRATGRDVPPLRGGMPVAIGVARRVLLEHLREGVEVLWEHELVDLVRDGDRIAGVRVAGAGGEREIPADIVVGADGTHSRVRELAGFPAELRVSDTAFVGFTSPVRCAEPFLIHFTTDGRQLTVLDWPGGSAGGWQIGRPPGGEQEALAPGVEAYRRAFVRLLPAAADVLAPVTRLRYREVTEVRCDEWWRPGVTLVGEALHALNPEVGIGSGLGMGDAQALAVAVQRNPGDADAALADYERWRRPAVEPYVQMGSQAVRVVRGGPPRPEERWPPDAEAAADPGGST